MQTMTVGNFKKDFSQVVYGLKQGNKYAISYGKSKQKLAVVIPFKDYLGKKRKLGVLSKNTQISISDDFKITDSELLSL